ncbi:MAG: transcription/translation regulatory transformer protein RfaH [Betaproteobacteria bacterium]|nr:transcription/translation regulatory transformer protein RfaH [Betaproteobacteria bacterium]
MHWYLVHTKPRQERRAFENLERQGYECYLPTIAAEKLRRGEISVIDEPLFPRYLFIRLGDQRSSMGWLPVRSTKGVSRLVTFGVEPARVEEELVGALRARSVLAAQHPQELFTPGERLRISEGPFAGLDAIYQMTDGERRVMVLIELLSKPVKLTLAPGQLAKGMT